MNFEELGRRLQQSGKADKIKQIAESEEGARLSSVIDTKALETAAKNGDDKALRNMLSQILSTEDGKKLAENIRKMMGD